MALNLNELKQLALAVVKADKNAPVAYSFGDKSYNYYELNEALRAELNEMGGSLNAYRRNKLDIFELIETIIDATVPKQILESYGQFAEVKTFAQGDKAVFVQKGLGRIRAKQFITRVGLAGIYEVFKLDVTEAHVGTGAFGGAAQIGLEEFLDGRADFAELTQIVMAGLDEAVYREIATALAGLKTSLPSNNIAGGTGFVEASMDKLIQIAQAYGQPTIYCTYAFAGAMVPASGWVSDNMKDEKWRNGYLANYKGTRVVILPQSYELVDLNEIAFPNANGNTKLNATSQQLLDDKTAYVIPSGIDAKPVKIAFEGQTQVDERRNDDWSREIQVYKKLGVALISNVGMCVYQAT